MLKSKHISKWLAIFLVVALMLSGITPISAADRQTSSQATKVRIDKTSNPYSGAWRSSTNTPFFTFNDNTSWWSDSWSWMYDNVVNTNDYVEFTFTGTSIALYMTKDDEGGIANIYLDGETTPTVFDTYHSLTTRESVIAFERNDLTAGEHTIKVATGGKSIAGNAYLQIEAFEYTPAQAQPTLTRIDKTSNPYSGAWRSSTNTPFFTFNDNTSWWSDSWSWMYDNVVNTNDYVEFTFTGTSIALYMTKDDEGGIANIYLDGETTPTVFDTYHSLTTRESVIAFERNDLADGEHKIRVATGGKSIAGNAYILIEAFEYTPSQVEPEPEPVTRIDKTSSPYSGAWNTNTSYPYFSFVGSGWWSDSWSWMYNNVSNKNASANLSFSGTTIILYMTKHSQGGIANIYIDDEFQYSVDTYSATRIQSAKVLEINYLPMGNHTLKVETAGKSITGDAFILIDAFEYGTNAWSGPGIKVTSLDKNEYALGESLDLNSIEVTYYDGVATPSAITVSPDMFSGFDSATVGDKTVTVTYNGYETSFRVEVVLPPLANGMVNLGELYSSEITASSTEQGFDPSNIIDGIYEGYKGEDSDPREDQAAEWASGQTTGAWIQQNFEYPVSISEIRLFDRMYPENAIYTGTLSFSDGTSINVEFPPLNPNPKTPAIVTLESNKTEIEWVRFTAETFNTTATSVGLAEFQVFGPEIDFMFSPENSSVEVVPGQDLTLKILRSTEGQTLSGTYDFVLPDGWAVISGQNFSAGSATDTIVISVPADYFVPQDNIAVTAKSSDGQQQYGYTMNIETSISGYSLIDKVITVFSPEYYSSISDSIEVKFNAPGFTRAKAFSLHAPDSTNSNEHGYMKAVNEDIILDTNEFGKGSFTFNAADFPYGPIAIHITAWNDQGESDDCYLQLFNYAGVEWAGGSENTINTIPKAIQGMDMEQIFLDEFTEMPAISYSGVGEDVKYAAAKPDPDGWPEYADAKFTPPNYSYGSAVTNYSPFEIVDNEYMKIETKSWGTVVEPNWGQTYTTGFLASMGTDRSGFLTEPGAAQYFETRFFLPPNPGLWPAFWTLTPDDPDGRPGFDELDVLEAYMGGNPDKITYNHHTWGDDYGGIHTGGSADTADFGNGINLAQGWHTYGLLVTEDYTYYYYDDNYIEGSAHETLDRSWTVGNYFMINNAYRQSDADKFPGGFERYGNTAEMYVDWVRVFQVQNPGFTPVKTKIEVTPDSTVSIDILRNDEMQGLSGTYNIELPTGWTVASGDSFSASSKDTIVLNIPQGYDEFTGNIYITPVVGATTYEPMQISYVTMGLYNTEIYPELNSAGDGYVLNFKYINNSTSTINNIEVVAKGPDSWTQTQTMPTITAAGSSVATFQIPALSEYSNAAYTFDVNIDNVYSFTLERPVSGLIASKAETPVTIDGVIHPDEWINSMTLTLGEEARSVSTSWTGPDDLRAAGKVKWDNDYLYIATEVVDDTFFMDKDNLVDAWARDSLQISIDPARVAGPVTAGPHLSFTVARNSITGQYGIAVDRSDYPELGLSYGQLLSQSDCAIVRDETNKITTYTLAFAWDEIMPAAYATTEDIGIAMVINDSDGAGRKGWLSYMGGIATGKDPKQFGDMILAENYVVTPSYAVSIAGVTGGSATVTADLEAAKVGDTVTVTVSNIEAGKQFKAISVSGVSGAVTTTAVVPGETFTFTMPSEAVTVAVEVETVEVIADYQLTLGDEVSGGAGKTRTINIGGSQAGNLAGKYLVVQFTEGEGVNAKISIVMIFTTTETTVSYQTAGTIVEAWLTSGMPDLTGENIGVNVYAHVASNQ